ncbi:MAG TPA: hypothetical protein PK140_04745 [Polyangiaceae bacterium]|nr:hypothetical protein [Polyangiaceae bacterium]HQF24204.1 hypothetical protein [Polyangiaceae bacterium]HQM08681.1 hypothetical protein [Polyangiaceae bacterium]
METGRLRLGELLVDARIISREQLESVLQLQKKDGRRLGSLLVEQGLINETQLTQILSQQLAVPWVSLYHVDFSKKLLSLVPSHVAQKYCLIPIYVRHLRGQGNTLYVAMDDPTNATALHECASWSGLPTRAMIASPSDILQAIEIYYGVASSCAETVREGTSHTPAPSPAAQATTPAIADEPPEIQSDEPSHEPLAAESRTEQASEQPSIQQPETTSAAQPTDFSNESLSAEQPATTSAMQDADETRLEASSEVANHTPEMAERRDSIHEVPVDDEVRPAVESASASIPTAQQDIVEIEMGEAVALEELVPSHAQRMKRNKLMSLTLLDGTTLALPMRRRGRRKESLVDSLAEEKSAPAALDVGRDAGEDAVPIRDIIAALRAAARGAAPSEALGNQAKSEAILAVVLSLLIRKGLITEDELLEELNKI